MRVTPWKKYAYFRIRVLTFFFCTILASRVIVHAYMQETDDYYIGVTHYHDWLLDDEIGWCEPLGTVPYGPGNCAYEVNQFCYYTYGMGAWGSYTWFDHEWVQEVGWSVDGTFTCAIND